MKKYNIKQAKNFMYTYGQMVYFVTEWKGGLILGGTLSNQAKNLISEVKTKIPEELRDERFNLNLKRLENIAIGKPADFE